MKTCLDSCLIHPLANLIQEMNSDDLAVQQKAFVETEKRLLHMKEEEEEEDGCRTALNKTMISPPQAPTEVSLFVRQLYKYRQ